MKVRDRDFPGQELGKITPYGVYGIAAGRGFVSAGTSCDTAASAVNALRLWWQREGALRYPGATRLLVTADAGGPDGYRCRLREDQLAVLAAETGLKISVVHFPPGTRNQNQNPGPGGPGPIPPSSAPWPPWPASATRTRWPVSSPWPGTPPASTASPPNAAAAASAAAATATPAWPGSPCPPSSPPPPAATPPACPAP